MKKVNHLYTIWQISTVVLGSELLESILHQASLFLTLGDPVKSTARTLFDATLDSILAVWTFSAIPLAYLSTRRLGSLAGRPKGTPRASIRRYATGFDKKVRLFIGIKFFIRIHS